MLAMPALPRHAKPNPAQPRRACHTEPNHAMPHRAKPGQACPATPRQTLPSHAEPAMSYDAASISAMTSSRNSTKCS